MIHLNKWARRKPLGSDEDNSTIDCTTSGVALYNISCPVNRLWFDALVGFDTFFELQFTAIYVTG
jgi:hypothetical protein